MNKYTSVRDLVSAPDAVKEALSLKQSQDIAKPYTKDKVLCLLFFNNSLRTRLSTELAGVKLGMKVMVMQINTNNNNNNNAYHLLIVDRKEAKLLACLFSICTGFS